MLRVTYIFPLVDNKDDGTINSPIAAALTRDLIVLTGGVTTYEAAGSYRMDNGELRIKPVVTNVTVVDDALLPQLRELAERACRMLSQECIYFEYQPTHLELIRG